MLSLTSLVTTGCGRSDSSVSQLSGFGRFFVGRSVGVSFSEHGSGQSPPDTFSLLFALDVWVVISLLLSQVGGSKHGMVNRAVSHNGQQHPRQHDELAANFVTQPAKEHKCRGGNGQGNQDDIAGLYKFNATGFFQ